MKDLHHLRGKNGLYMYNLHSLTKSNPVASKGKLDRRANKDNIDIVSYALSTFCSEASLRHNSVASAAGVTLSMYRPSSTSVRLTVSIQTGV